MSAEAIGRLGTLLLALVGLGEMAVGVLIAAFPSIATLLIGTPLDPGGLLLARMTGVAALVIGLTWWLARRAPDRIVRHAPGFILYNIGVGAVFVLAAMSASRPQIPWILAIAHVAAGTVFAAAVAMVPPPAGAPRN